MQQRWILREVAAGFCARIIEVGAVVLIEDARVDDKHHRRV